MMGWVIAFFVVLALCLIGRLMALIMSWRPIRYLVMIMIAFVVFVVAKAIGS